MDAQSLEMAVKYADWSDGARAGLKPSGGEGTLTASSSDAGGLALYLERGETGGLLHMELSADDARRLYDLLRSHLGGPTPAPPAAETARRGGRRQGRMKNPHLDPNPAGVLLGGTSLSPPDLSARRGGKLKEKSSAGFVSPAWELQGEARVCGLVTIGPGTMTT